MGKSAKIRKLNTLCKANGLGRFYKGKGRLVKGVLSGGVLDALLEIFSIQPGTVVHDCDGFNHVVKGLVGPDRYRVYTADRELKAWYWYEDQLEFADGRFSCGCPAGIQPALSREDIEKWYRGWLDYYVSTDDGKGFVTQQHHLMHKALQKGKHICDERGIILDEYRNF
jgi:hypothetical protein